MLKRLRNGLANRFAKLGSIDVDPYRDFRIATEEIGFQSLFCFLSFDCDTEEDAGVILDFSNRLLDHQMKFTLSVPGETLQAGASVYSQLSNQGVEFINHGFSQHAVRRDGEYVGTTFYGEMSLADIELDIQRGHDAVIDVTGQTPVGFRTPHFGTFQQQSELDLIYSILADRGYRYSTSTLPEWGLTCGSVIRRAGIVELPLMGSLSSPTTLIDSWTYLEDRSKLILSEEYFVRMAETISYFEESGIKGPMSFYADPSHVSEQEPFWKAIELMNNLNIRGLSGLETVKIYESLLSCK